MEHKHELDRLRQMYDPAHEANVLGINSAWHPRSPVSMYYRHAQERAIVRLLNHLELDLRPLTILDFGCGIGVEMRYMISMGASAGKLYAFDLMAHRVRAAQAQAPHAVNLMVANGEVVPLRDQTFDLIYQFVVFSSIFDAGVRAAAAGEIVRLLKPGGILLWYDTRLGVRGSGFTLELPELGRLFPGMLLRYTTRLHAMRLSSVIRHSWSLAAIWDRLPFIPRTHLLAVLQKAKLAS